MATIDPEALLVVLDPAQVEAVRITRRPLVIHAGAGSGKTRVVTHRVAYAVATGAVEPAADPRRHVHRQGRRRDGRAPGRARPSQDRGRHWIADHSPAAGRRPAGEERGAHAGERGPSGTRGRQHGMDLADQDVLSTSWRVAYPGGEGVASSCGTEGVTCSVTGGWSPAPTWRDGIAKYTW